MKCFSSGDYRRQRGRRKKIALKFISLFLTPCVNRENRSNNTEIRARRQSVTVFRFTAGDFYSFSRLSYKHRSMGSPVGTLSDLKNHQRCQKSESGAQKSRRRRDAPIQLQTAVRKTRMKIIKTSSKRKSNPGSCHAARSQTKHDAAKFTETSARHADAGTRGFRGQRLSRPGPRPRCTVCLCLCLCVRARCALRSDVTRRVAVLHHCAMRQRCSSERTTLV